jgi:hypothetical protein
MTSPFPSLDASNGAIAMPVSVAFNPFNPANFNDNEGFSFSFSRAYHFGTQNENALLLSWGGKWYNIGLSGQTNSISDIEARTTPTDEPDYTFTARQFSGGLTASFSPLHGLSIGASVLHVYEKIDAEDMGTKAFNLGLHYNHRLFFTGASITNAGGQVRYRNNLYELPLTYRFAAGTSFRMLDGELGLEKPDKEEFRFRTTLRGKPLDFLSATISYKSGLDTRSLSFGTDLIYKNFVLSYSLTPYSDGLGLRHAIGLSGLGIK